MLILHPNRLANPFQFRVVLLGFRHVPVTEALDQLMLVADPALVGPYGNFPETPALIHRVLLVVNAYQFPVVPLEDVPPTHAAPYFALDK